MALILELFRNGNLILASAYEDSKRSGAAIFPLDEHGPITDEVIDKLCSNVIATLDKANYTKVASLVDLQRAGQQLWLNLLPHQVAKKIRTTQTQDLILIVDDNLVQVPWELLFDGQYFLMERFNVGRMVRAKQDLWVTANRVLQRPLKMLILADPSDDLEEAYKEGEAVFEALHQYEHLISATFQSGPIDKNIVMENLLDYDIILFTGHSLYTAGDPSNTGWLLTYQGSGDFETARLSDQGELPPDGLQDGELAHLRELLGIQRKNLYELEKRKALYGINIPLDIINGIDLAKEEIARIEEQMARLREVSGSRFQMGDRIFGPRDIESLTTLALPFPTLVVSNSCKSGYTERWNSKEVTYGIVNAFLRAGVPYYIGTFWEIQDSETTSDFTIALFEGLAIKGLPIGEAVRNARNALVQKFGRERIAWASYVLYGDPTTRLIEAEPAALGPSRKQEVQDLLTGAIASETKGLWEEAKRLYVELRQIADDAGIGDLLQMIIRERLQTLEETIEENITAVNDLKEQGRGVTTQLKQVGPYRIMERIGFGQYKTMYRAESYNEDIPDPYVALGVPHIQEKEQVKGEVERFQQLISLNHPHLVQVFASGEGHGVFYTAYEYVEEAKTLTQVLEELEERGERMPIDRAVAYAIQLCEALDYAHDNGILHCDLHPDNILINQKDQIKVKDIGLVQVRGELNGTTKVHYAAPEQIKRNARTSSVDIWAAGVITYQMLTSSLPFGTPDDTDHAVAEKILKDWPPPPTLLNPDVSWELSGVVVKALDRRQRYESAGQMTQELQRISEGRPLIPPVEESIQLHLRAGYTLLYVMAEEEQRAMAMLQRVGMDLGVPVYSWTTASGLDTPEDTDEGRFAGDHIGILNWFGGRSESAILVLRDFHPYLQNFAVQSYLSSLYHRLRQRGLCAIVFLSPFLVLPEGLEKKVAVFAMEPPNQDEIRALIEGEQQRLQEEPGGVAHVSVEDIHAFVWQAHGMALEDVERALQKSVAKRGGLFPGFTQDLLEAKGEVVRKSGLLEFCQPKVTFTDVGGAEVLREYVRFVGSALQAGGWMPVPKGWLLLGVPGCGKSLSAKAIAGEWGVPLLRLDVGRIYGSLLGEAEANMYQVIEIAERVSPAVLWIDEIEKGFAGVHSGGAGGTMARVFGILLTWLQERVAPVFVVATANTVVFGNQMVQEGGTRRKLSILDVAPELFRAGRFDAIFFFDLPTVEERAEILQILFQKYECLTQHLAIDELVRASQDATGVEIEQCIISALYEAHAEGRSHLETQDVLKALQTCKLVARIHREEIEELREFGRQAGALWVTSPEFIK